MIHTILCSAQPSELLDAKVFTATHLHVGPQDITDLIAVAYICQHFEQGTYSGWDGFVEMLEADAR